MTQAFNLSQLANKVNTSGQLDASTGLVNTTPVANGGTGKATNSAGTLLLGNGTSAMTELTGGTTNNVVAWSGTAWTSTPAASIVGGDYILTSYTSPATYVKPTTLKGIKITVVGSGGNGGTTTGTAVFPTGGSGGGGGGGAAIRYVDAPALPSSPIAITAGTGTNSFGAFASATAGSAGGIGTNNNVNGAGGGGGAGSSGTINFAGTAGTAGQIFATNLGGSSGSSAIFSGSLFGVSALNVNGTSNTIYGGGGTGGGASSTSTLRTGGTGGSGIVIIEEFY